jgi:hypothetical protein
MDVSLDPAVDMLGRAFEAATLMCLSVATVNCSVAGRGPQWRPLRCLVTADEDPGATLVSEPAVGGTSGSPRK